MGEKMRFESFVATLANGVLLGMFPSVNIVRDWFWAIILADILVAVGMILKYKDLQIYFGFRNPEPEKEEKQMNPKMPFKKAKKWLVV